MLSLSSAARSCRGRACHTQFVQTRHAAARQGSTLYASSQSAVGLARQLTQHAQVRCAPSARTSSVKVAAGLQRPSQFLTLQQRHPFASCMKHMLSKAAMQPTPQHQQAIAFLEQQQRPDDYWLLVECGVWDGHPDMPVGWAGPARTIMQCWMASSLCADYAMWILDKDGLPTGEKYHSGNEMELLTSKHKGKKFAASSLVLSAEGFPDTRLETWVKYVLGGDVRFVRMTGGIHAPTTKKSLRAAVSGEREKGAAAAGRARMAGSASRSHGVAPGAQHADAAAAVGGSATAGGSEAGRGAAASAAERANLKPGSSATSGAPTGGRNDAAAGVGSGRTRRSRSRPTAGTSGS